MRILRESIKNSPYLGIFCIATEKHFIVPEQAERKVLEKIEEALEAEAIKASIASTSLLGVLAKANKHGIIIPEIAEREEVQELEEKGIKAKVIKGNLALGNLIALNDSKAVLSPLISKKQQGEIEKFLKVECMQAKIGSSELAGSSMVLTNNGFLINNNASKQEFEKIKAFLGVEGKGTTANYGDSFVGNSVIANTKAVIVGSLTTNIELLRIKEGLEV
ncbi:MAG: translation initiation factor IF-6 [Candidatus Diapherotrites archaeon]|uniref:Translation initiation factor IF-6 n=1 Tax=Candidatus Iainarchaeum sp. TaxID=3101447 RepID=A0A7J4JX30_9ARCH|nr:translation initiation factor IF-6 [Candidatus Diapherotrites archaeon]HIH22014.1 translation initiation factor IF-6 [Candidatus Diapherotrites archaeon]HIH32726.1 translation initiation factor IF-6 [Candidatus Diapherotrites archaeon]